MPHAPHGARLAAGCAWLFASCLVCTSSLAQDKRVPGGPESFAPALLAAMRSGSGNGRLVVIHTMSRRCITESSQPYFEWMFSRQAKTVATGRMRVTVQPIEAAAGVPTTDGNSDYPVRPTHQLQLDFDDGAYKSASLIAYVAREAGQWREVLPCPRGDVRRQATLNQANASRESGRVTTLLAAMPTELRTEIQSLLAAGSKVEAIRRYSAAANQDLSTSKAVVESLMTQGAR